MKNLVHLLRYVVPQWKPLAILIVSMFGSVAVNLIRPWPLKILVDNVLGHQPLPPFLQWIFDLLPGPHSERALLFWLCASVVLAVLAWIGVGMTHALASVVFGQRLTYALGADIFHQVQRFSLLFHSRRPVGDTVARITGDTDCVQSFVEGIALRVVQSVFTIATMFVILWRLNPQMTLVSLGVIPMLMINTRIFAPPMRVFYRQRRDLEGGVMSLVQDTLGAVPAIQAFGREETQVHQYRDYGRRAVSIYTRTTIAELLFQIAVGLVIAVAGASLLYIGGVYALEGQVTAGTIILFLAYLVSFFGPLQSLSAVVSQFQFAAAKADRVTEILDTVPDVRDRPDAHEMTSGGVIRYEDVCFGYEEGVPVLKGISFESRPGEVVAIVGPTGAGKTTLVSLLMRFFDPWSGRVTIADQDIREFSIDSLRAHVSVVLQDPFIFPMTAAENIAFGKPDATEEEIAAAAVAANADDFIRRLPQGYDTVIGERGSTLSGGEKQRIAIARAFVKDAPILILDEPTSALDARTEGRLLDAMTRLMESRTTIVIAHRLSTIRNADRILVLDHGEIVEQGDHGDLIAQDGLYARLYRQQMTIAQHDDSESESASQAVEDVNSVIDRIARRIGGETTSHGVGSGVSD